MESNKNIKINEEEISRREAIKKIGYATATASMMMVLLNTQQARASSNEPAKAGTSGGQTTLWNP